MTNANDDCKETIQQNTDKGGPRRRTNWTQPPRLIAFSNLFRIVYIDLCVCKHYVPVPLAIKSNLFLRENLQSVHNTLACCFSFFGTFPEFETHWVGISVPIPLLGLFLENSWIRPCEPPPFSPL